MMLFIQIIVRFGWKLIKIREMAISTPLILKMGSLMDEEKFFTFCQINDLLEFERNSQGDIILLPFRGSYFGWLNAGIGAKLKAWNNQGRKGVLFGPSTGFTLPNKSVRSPDISWIQNERWEALNKDEKEVFAPICPDFILEILSVPEETAYVHEKMKEYIECGAQLGWLIDYNNSSVYIYNSDGGITFIDSLKVKLSGDPVLPGFVLDLESLIN